MGKRPRPNPRVVELPFVINNIKPGTILNIGGSGGEWKWDLAKKHKMTIVDTAPLHGEMKHPVTYVLKDIRRFDNGERYDNIILMSTIEHISLPWFYKDKKPTWKISPWDEQLKTWHHCMSLLKPDGHMLFTVPCGIPSKTPHTKLHYDEKMLNEIKSGYKVLQEKYYIRPEGTDWLVAPHLPDDLFSHKEEMRMQGGWLITRALALMVITHT